MIPPRERKDQPTDGERQALAEAWKLAQLFFNVAAGLETRGVPSVSLLWDTTALLLALLRRESEKRGAIWEEVEARVLADSYEHLEEMIVRGELKEKGR